MPIDRRLLAAFLVCCLTCVLHAAGHPVDVRIDRDSASIANEHLRLVMPAADRPAALQDRVARLENRLTGDALQLAGDTFALELADGKLVRDRDLALRSVSRVTVSPTIRQLVLDFAADGLEVRCVTRLDAAQWWATRWLEIRDARDPAANDRRIVAVRLAAWPCVDAKGPAAAGGVVPTLGYPSGCGQAVYIADGFVAIAHPGAENFAAEGKIACRMPCRVAPASHRDEEGKTTRTRTPQLLIGVARSGAARRAFLGAVDAMRAVRARMVFYVNDWYFKDKSNPLALVATVAQAKIASGVPIDSFTLDDGWDFDWNKDVGIWGRLHRERFPGGWKALQDAARPASMDISLWFGPIGGYAYRPKRVAYAREVGYEIQRDRLCLVGPRYRRHVEESFAQWAARGMDYIKVDGFWPDCAVADHGHAVGPGAAIEQMDALIGVFDAWRRGRPDLLIGYTSGSSPSPFWLLHADFVWRGGRDDFHAGVGAPFDRHNTFLDICLQRHRTTDMPVSAFVTFDIVHGRIAGNSDEVFERGAWWLAARTSLHHDWYVRGDDLTLDRWKMLARVSHWAKRHEQLFRWSHMVGGDPGRGEAYRFAAYDARNGTLALRNPSAESRSIEGTLADLLDVPTVDRATSFEVRSVFGHTQQLVGKHAATAPIRVELPALAIAVVEIKTATP